MMATYKSSILCVILCIAYSVHSAKILGTINTTEVEFSEYINGDNWDNIDFLRLYRLLDGETLPTLTLTNLKSLSSLNMWNISLEYVPVFENVSIDSIRISGTKIKYIPTNGFNGAHVRRLNLEKNKIQSMSVRSINVDVLELKLRCNKLGDFSQAWFKDPSSLHRLDLTGNRIEYIQHQAFNQMAKLSTLELSDNHIKSIGSEAFGPGITHLHLQFNNIELLTSDMFAGHDVRIDSLSVHHNQLSFLTEALLLKLKPKFINLDGNPWQCQCLRDIERWIREQNLTRSSLSFSRDDPVCVLPRNFVNTCVPAVDKELQQTYARELSSVQGCWERPCNSSCV